MSKTDWSNIAFWLFLLALVILTAGDPDVIDGLAKRANAVPVDCRPGGKSATQGEK